MLIRLLESYGGCKEQKVGNETAWSKFHFYWLCDLGLSYLTLLEPSFSYLSRNGNNDSSYFTKWLEYLMGEFNILSI